TGRTSLQPSLGKPSNAARLAIVYITVGAIPAVWSAIWWYYLRTHNGVDLAYYWCYGFLFTGLVLLIIGFTLGRIGRAARHAELPPETHPGQNTAQPAVTSPPGGAAAVPGGATPAAPGFGAVGAAGAPGANGGQP